MANAVSADPICPPSPAGVDESTFFRILTERVFDLVAVLDAEARLSWMSPSVQTTLGYSPQEFLGRSALHFVHPDDQDRIREFLKTIFATPGATGNVSYRARCNDGSWLSMEASVTNLLREPAIQGLVVNALDVTARIDAEEKLERFGRVYGVLAETRRAILRGGDRDELFREACRIAVERGGYRMAWVGLVEKTTHEVRLAARWGVDAGYLDAIRVSTTEHEPEGWGPSGTAVRSARPVVVHDVASDPRMAPWRDEALRRGYRASAAFPLIPSDEPVGSLNVYADDPRLLDDANAGLIEQLAGDISFALRAMEQEERRVEAEREMAGARDAALEASRLKSAFLANMSHEIRTPLNVISGYIAMIAERASDFGDELISKECLPAIDRAVERLTDTVHGILDLAKLESGTFATLPGEVDLEALVRREVESFREAAVAKGLRFDVDVQEPGVRVLFDDYCLSQSLRHLLSNAVKFTRRGSVAVRVIRDADDPLRIEVADTGIGIDRKYLPNLFSPFSQEETGPSRPFEGSGLGLTLVRGYLTLNDAAVTVESEKGRGTTFRIHLPKAAELPARVTGRAPKSAVLVVEDDLDSQTYMRAILRPSYEVLVADSCGEARKILEDRGQNVACVLLDISLRDEEDGLSLVRWLRQTDDHPHLPCIAVTAHAFAEDRRNADDAGCDAFVAKPFQRRELLRVMDRLVEGSRGVP